MSMKSQSFVITPGEQVPLRVVGETISILATAQATGSYEVFLQHGPEGAGPPPHFHDWDEAYYVLEGRMDVTVDNRTRTVSAGEFIHIPRGVVHAFRLHAGGAKFLSINSGAGAAQFFQEMDREVGGEMNIPRILDVASRHGVSVPPPPAVQ